MSPSDYRIAVPGSVLAGAADGNGYLGAQLANSVGYDDYWTVLQQGGVDIPVDDPIIDKMETQFKAPVTKMQSLEKLGSALSAMLFGWAVGVEGGKFLSSNLGLDGQYLCQPVGIEGQPFEDFGFISTVTNAQCDQGFDPDYVTNADVTPGEAWPSACATNGSCAVYVGSYLNSSGPTRYHCFRTTGWVDGATSMYVAMSYAPSSPVNTTGSTSSTWCGSFGGSGLRWLDQWYSQSTATVLSYAVRSGSDNATTKPLLAPSTVPADPERKLRCDIKGTNGTTYSAFSSPYKESDGVLPQIVCPELPPGVGPAERTIWDTGSGTDRELDHQSLTDEAGDWLADYPECANGSCPLELYIVTGTGVQSCYDDPTKCVDWFEDPERSDHYQCRYGGHDVDLSECFIYSQKFKPQNLNQGTVWADPATGAPINVPSTKPGGTYPGTVTNPDEKRQCYPTGWGVLNPVEWVVKPVSCAIEWAFVPRNSVAATVRTGWETKVNTSIFANIGQIIDGVTGAFEVSSANCQGPPFHIEFGPGPLFGDGGMDETYYPFSACEEPMAGYALIFNSLTTGGMFLAAQFATMRYIAAIFGYVGFGRSGNGATSGVTFKDEGKS